MLIVLYKRAGYWYWTTETCKNPRRKFMPLGTSGKSANNFVGGKIVQGTQQTRIKHGSQGAEDLGGLY